MNRGFVGTLALLIFAAAAVAAKARHVIEGNSITGTRDARYCEIIPIVREGFHLTATVYNTLRLKRLPAGDLGRHHHAGVDGKIRLSGADRV